MADGGWNGRRIWLGYALFSLAAVASGTVTLFLSESLPLFVALNGIAWVAGAVLSFVILIFGGQWVRLSVLPIAVAALAAVFLFPDVDGVHRWLDLGPLAVNAAALFLPITIVAMAQTGIRKPLSIGTAALILTILIFQPDASQATAFAIAVALIVAYAGVSPRARVIALGLLLATIALAWARSDALQPVPESELVFDLAWQVSPVLVFVGVVALAGVALIPLARRSPLPPTGETQALTGYFLATALCTLAGHYPVPLVGLGMSFVIGYWLGIGLLCRNHAR